MKRFILKCVVQFLIVSVLLVLVYHFWIRGGSEGSILIEIFIKVPFVVTVGVLAGDLGLYRGEEFSFLAVVMGAILCILGIIVSLFINSFLERFGNQLEIAAFIITVIFVEVLPIIGYNLMSEHKRKSLWSEN